MKILLSFALILLIPLVASAQDTTSVAPDAAQALTFELLQWEPRPYEIEHLTLDGEALRSVKKTYDADYGTLAVPERRDDPDTRMIELPVVRIRATGAQPAEPIFWFEGGPGQTNMETFDFDFFIEKHDHVMIGYRGVDGAVSLDCDEVKTVLKSVDDVLIDETLDRIGAAYAACWARLEGEGVDIHGYTIVEVVRDMESARRALGYETISLMAESFGTRLAYLYGVMYPQSIRRTLLIGANPPGGMVWDPVQADAFIEHYAGLWAEDPEARARTADLTAAVRAVTQDMPRRWLFSPSTPATSKRRPTRCCFIGPRQRWSSTPTSLPPTAMPAACG